ncbi:MAG: Rab family GTPase [Promethearchaeota archaeon]
MTTNIYKLKIIIIGEHAAGKTSLIKNFVEGAYTKDYRPTIGSNLFIKKLAFKNKEGDKFQFTITCWDIAGQERWTSMRHTYYRGAQGVFVVGDLTRKHSFKQIKDFWVDDFRNNGGTSTESVPLIMIANKKDLTPEIEEDQVREIATACGIEKILFTSAKTGYHVIESFIAMIKSCSGLEDITPIPL